MSPRTEVPMSHALYGERATLYDLIYHWKNYDSESESLHALLEAEGAPDGARLLDAACGTGQHMARLARWYDVSGFDLNAEMLAVARAKLPHAPLFQADLTRLSVSEPYQVITCLFSAIAYLCTEAELVAAARSLAGALAPGGVLVVEPWLTVDQYTVGRPSLQTYSSPELYLARATVSDADGDVSIMDMHWLVAAKGHPVEHFSERHALWMCPRQTMADAFQEAGVDVRYVQDGLMKDRGLFIGRKRHT